MVWNFAPCTGKQVERVEELFGEQSKDFWILGDSATRIKHQGEYIYQSLLNNTLGLDIIGQLEAIEGSHIVIACTPEFAAIRRDTQAFTSTGETFICASGAGRWLQRYRVRLC